VSRRPRGEHPALEDGGYSWVMNEAWSSPHFGDSPERLLALAVLLRWRVDQLRGDTDECGQEWFDILGLPLEWAAAA